MIYKKRSFFNTDTRLGEVPIEWLRYIEPHVTRNMAGACWLWHGPIDTKGYPYFHKNGKSVRVFRFVAKLFFDFPKRTVLKHVCEHRNCVRPDHINFGR